MGFQWNFSVKVTHDLCAGKYNGLFWFHLALLSLPSWKPPIFYPAYTSCLWFSSYLSDPSWNSVADTSSSTRLQLWAEYLYIQLTTWHTSVGRTGDCRVASVTDRCGRRWEKEVSRMITRVLSFTEIRNRVGGEWAPYNTSSRSFPEIWFLPTEPFRRMRQQAEGWGLFPSKKNLICKDCPPRTLCCDHLVQHSAPSTCIAPGTQLSE